MYNSENLRWYRRLGKHEKKIVKEYLLELYIDRFDVTKELVKARLDELKEIVGDITSDVLDRLLDDLEPWQIEAIEDRIIEEYRKESKYGRAPDFFSVENIYAELRSFPLSKLKKIFSEIGISDFDDYIGL